MWEMAASMGKVEKHTAGHMHGIGSIQLGHLLDTYRVSTNFKTSILEMMCCKHPHSVLLRGQLKITRVRQLYAVHTQPMLVSYSLFTFNIFLVNGVEQI